MSHQLLSFEAHSPHHDRLDYHMPDLTADQKKQIAEVLQRFLSEELDMELGRFEADDLTDFVIEKIGPWFYNQGVLDARAKLGNLAEGISEEMALLEKASPLDR